MTDERLASAIRYHDRVTAERKLTAADIAVINQLLSRSNND